MEGYINAFINELCPGIIRINWSEQKPDEISQPKNEWTLPTQFTLLTSKKVTDPENKLNAIYTLIEKRRINKSEFFRIGNQEFDTLFSYIDGEVYSIKIKEKLDFALTNGQTIRHIAGNNIWYAKYDLESNTLVSKGVSYKSLTAFAKSHYSIVEPFRNTVNGFIECEMECEGGWTKIN